jgi:hypothetical protein
MRHDLDMPGLFFAEAQVISAEAEFNWIAHWCTSDDFNTGAIAEAHFKQTATKIRIAANANDAAVTSNPELVQGAGGRRTAVVATGESTSFLHVTYFRACVRSIAR